MSIVKPCIINEIIIVKGKIEEVFDFIANFSNASLWHPGVLESHYENDLVESTKIDKGSSFNLKALFKNKIINMIYEITKYIRPYEVILYGDGNIIYDTYTIKFKKIDNEHVQIDYTANISLKGFRRPFIIFFKNELEIIGQNAKFGIKNYYNVGNKLGLK